MTEHDDEAETDGSFLAEDFRFTAELLRKYVAEDRTDLFRAVCSNNLNIILAALDQAGVE